MSILAFRQLRMHNIVSNIIAKDYKDIVGVVNNEYICHLLSQVTGASHPSS